jgi:hypothetical protein
MVLNVLRKVRNTLANYLFHWVRENLDNKCFTVRNVRSAKPLVVFDTQRGHVV